MTPGNYMYFDFYQADPKTQPYAIGGYTPIKKVYSYNPIPVDSLTAEESKHIMEFRPIPGQNISRMKNIWNI